MKFICRSCKSCAPCIVDFGDIEVDERLFACVMKTRNNSCKWEKLPKLTAEVFDREDCPKWAKYAFVGNSGRAVFIEVEPEMSEDKFAWLWKRYARRQLIPGVFDSSDWQNSLIKRPEKKPLPDWCKVGDFVYYKVLKKYCRIVEIGDSIITIESLDGGRHSNGIKNFQDYVLQARLRP